MTLITCIIFKAYKKYLQNIFYIFFLYIKMTNNYYQKHKEDLWKEAREIHQKLSEEKKIKKQKEADEKYQNLSEDEKLQKAKKCPRKISKFYWRRKRKKGSVSSWA